MADTKNNNKNLSPEEILLNEQTLGEAPTDADAAIFGEAPETHTADAMGVVQRNPNAAPDAPVVVNKGRNTANKEETITIKASQFNQIMDRLGDLESVAIKNNRSEKNNIFNPLTDVVTEHVVDVTFHGDDIVVGYKEKVRPNGMRTFTWIERNPESGESRTKVTLLLRSTSEKEEDGSPKIYEETVDYVGFLTQAVTVKAKIVDRKDVGEVVEQGLVNQMVWNGKTLVETSTQILTGAKEQRFIFKVEMPNGDILNLAGNVVNIKS